MKFVYISRSFNRIGYSILKYLIEHKFSKPKLVVLSNKNIPDNYKSEITYLTKLSDYKKRAKVQKFKAIKFTKSIHKLCIKNNIRVRYAKTLKKGPILNVIKKVKPELIVLGGGYHEKLTREFLKIPTFGVINSHPSKLPLYRGTDVHRWQILNKVKLSGLTIHLVDRSFDTGNIISFKKVKINKHETPQGLVKNISKISGKLMLKTLETITSKKTVIFDRKQKYKNSKIFYYSKWPWSKKRFLKINWLKNSEDIDALVRSCHQEDYKFNGPYFIYKGNYYFLRECSLVKMKSLLKFGTIIKTTKLGLYIKCGKNKDNYVLIIKKIQPFKIENWDMNSHFRKSIKLNDLNSKKFFSKLDRLN